MSKSYKDQFKEESVRRRQRQQKQIAAVIILIGVLVSAAIWYLDGLSKEQQVPQQTSQQQSAQTAEQPGQEVKPETPAAEPPKEEQKQPEAVKPAYTIFTDRVLQEMVERKPVTLYDFARISGVGEAKVSRYGKQFVDLLRKELNVKREKGDSYIETLMLLRQGLTIEQVAESRNLKLVTIYSHIAELIISRKLTDWSNYISVFEIESVANVISSSESKTQNLKPIYEALNGEIDYGKIRLALAVLSLE